MRSGSTTRESSPRLHWQCPIGVDDLTHGHGVKGHCQPHGKQPDIVAALHRLAQPKHRRQMISPSLHHQSPSVSWIALSVSRSQEPSSLDQSTYLGSPRVEDDGPGIAHVVLAGRCRPHSGGRIPSYNLLKHVIEIGRMQRTPLLPIPPRPSLCSSSLALSPVSG